MSDPKQMTGAKADFPAFGASGLTAKDEAMQEVYLESLSHLSVEDQAKLMIRQTNTTLREKMEPLAEQVKEREKEIQRYNDGLLKGDDLERRLKRLSRLEDGKVAIRDLERRRMGFMELVREGNALHDKILNYTKKAKEAAGEGNRQVEKHYLDQVKQAKKELERNSQAFNRKFGFLYYGYLALAFFGICYIFYKIILWIDYHPEKQDFIEQNPEDTEF